MRAGSEPSRNIPIVETYCRELRAIYEFKKAESTRLWPDLMEQYRKEQAFLFADKCTNAETSSY